METTAEHPKAVIRVFDGTGDTILKEYDPQTADMKEINDYIHGLEESMHARAFDLNTGNAIDEVTKENTDTAMLPQWCGG